MDKEELQSKTVAELKVMLADLSLPVSGRKSELIDRIINSLPVNPEPSDDEEIVIRTLETANETAAEEIENVVSNMVEGRIVKEESEITLQTIILIAGVVIALGLVVFSL